jgi:CBS domain-containing protein
MPIQRATKISDIMTKKLETVGSSSSAHYAAIKMRDKQVSSILVMDERDGTPQGIITERDLSRKVCVSDKSRKELLANQIMSSPLITVNADSSPSDAADLMLKNKVRHLLVIVTKPNKDRNKKGADDVGEGITKPVGIITPMDFTRFKVTATPDHHTDDNDEDNGIEKILDYYRNDFNFA